MKIDHGLVKILTMSHDEELVYAAIAAVAQAKIEQYSPLLEDEGCGPEGEGIGADARTLAGMLANEEKGVLGDLRLQLMSEVSEAARMSLPYGVRRQTPAANKPVTCASFASGCILTTV